MTAKKIILIIDLLVVANIFNDVKLDFSSFSLGGDKGGAAAPPIGLLVSFHLEEGHGALPRH
jgi:hypothetical protein